MESCAVEQESSISHLLLVKQNSTAIFHADRVRDRNCPFQLTSLTLRLQYDILNTIQYSETILTPVDIVWFDKANGRSVQTEGALL
jgi:hypothetical protein